jgi:beta-galactosidase
VIGARSATRDRRNQVIPETAPGCLRALVGATVEEYGRQNTTAQRPLDVEICGQTLRSAFWYEVLKPDAGTEVLATWKSRHLDGSPAVTRHAVGGGSVVYVGLHLTAPVVEALRPTLATLAGLGRPWPDAPERCTVTVREGAGYQLWFFFNESDQPMILPSLPVGSELTSGKPAKGPWALERHGLAIVRVAG